MPNRLIAVVFLEAVTVDKQPLSSAAAPKHVLSEDAIGVIVGNVRVPWGNVKFATYAPPDAPKAKP